MDDKYYNLFMAVWFMVWIVIICLFSITISLNKIAKKYCEDKGR